LYGYDQNQTNLSRSLIPVLGIAMGAGLGALMGKVTNVPAFAGIHPNRMRASLTSARHPG
jgi:uncharacterized membrane protein